MFRYMVDCVIVESVIYVSLGLYFSGFFLLVLILFSQQPRDWL